MDTKKWKSVLLPKDVYDEVRVMSHVEGRTISGQLRIIFESWKNDNLTAGDKKMLKDELDTWRAQQPTVQEPGEAPVFSVCRRSRRSFARRCPSSSNKWKGTARSTLPM